VELTGSLAAAGNPGARKRQRTSDETSVVNINISAGYRHLYARCRGAAYSESGAMWRVADI
jgi:hypothetical protein